MAFRDYSHIDEGAKDTLAYRKKKAKEQAAKVKVERLRRDLLAQKSVLFQKQQELKRLATEKVRLRRELNMLTSRHQSDETRLESDNQKLKEHQDKLRRLEEETAKLTAVLKKEGQKEKGLVSRMRSTLMREKGDYEQVRAEIREHENKLRELEREFRKIQLEYSQKMQQERNIITQAKIRVSKESREFDEAKSAYEAHAGKPEELSQEMEGNLGAMKSKISGEKALIAKLKSGMTRGERDDVEKEKEIERLETHMRGVESGISTITMEIKRQEDKVTTLEGDLRKAEQDIRTNG